MPSYSMVLPELGRLASFRSFLISPSVAPSNTGVAIEIPSDLRGPAEVGLEDLTDVHARGHAQGIQHDVDRRAVRQVRQVGFRQDAGDDALVAVAAGHLVADRELALHGDVDLDHLDDAGRQLVALLQELDALRVDPVQDLDLRVLAPEHDLDLVGDLFVLQLQALQLRRGQARDPLQGELRALLDDLAAVAVGRSPPRRPARSGGRGPSCWPPRG